MVVQYTWFDFISFTLASTASMHHLSSMHNHDLHYVLEFYSFDMCDIILLHHIEVISCRKLAVTVSLIALHILNSNIIYFIGHYIFNMAACSIAI